MVWEGSSKASGGSGAFSSSDSSSKLQGPSSNCPSVASER
ncbi:hypothetical protein AVEN_49193-1, partial [Araneus ventricosus]